MKHVPIVLAAVCALFLAGVAGGQVAYDDVNNGYWNADATWDQGSGYPQSTGDTALIDTNSVTMNIDTPADVSITLGGGTMVVYQNPVSINSPISVTAPSEIYQSQTDHAGTNKMWLNGAITGASLLTVDTQFRGVRVYNSNTGFSGGWQLDSGYLLAYADQAFGSGAVTVNGGQLIFAVDQPGYATPLPVTVNAGGGVNVAQYSDVSKVALTYTANGDYYIDKSYTFSGTVNIGANTLTITGGGDNCNDRHKWGADVLNGTGAVVLDSGCRGFELNGGQSGYSGTWEVNTGALIVNSTDAFGTGAGPLVCRYNGDSRGLVIKTIDPNMPDITLDGGSVFNMVSAGTGSVATAITVTANGGKLFADGWTPWGADGQNNEYSGTIALTGDLNAYAKGRHITLSGELTGAGKVTKTGGSTLYMSNVGTSFTGDVEVSAGTAQVDATGSLGSGEAVAKGGTIRSNIDDAFMSASQVVSDENGTVDINSTENNATLRIKPGGALKVSSGSTVLNYTGTPIGGQATVYVEAGCILYEGFPHPTAAQFEVGDGGFGAFKATNTGDHTVGKYSGTIYRGLANTAGTATFSGNVTEAAATGGDPDPTEGIGMLATGPATFQYMGSVFTTVNTNTIKFYGAGAHVIQDSNTFNNDLEKFGVGKVEVEAVSGITGKTLTVRGGYLEIGDPDALGGAVVNLEGPAGNEPGGIFRQERYLAAASGTINVKAGAGVCLVGDNFSIRTDLAGGATWNFDPGSQVVLPGTGGMGDYWDPYDGDLGPAFGKASFLLYNGSNPPDGLGLTGTSILGGLQMGEQTRLTIAPWNATTIYGHRYQSGDLTLALGHTSFKVCAPTDHTLAIAAVINLDLGTGQAGTMVVGDTNDFHAVTMNGTEWVDIGQAGIVQLEGLTNNIGAIDVQAGTLRTDNAASIGGAASIRIAENATWYSWNALDLATVVSGDGTAQMPTLTLTPSGGQAAGISPGDSIGTLTVDGNLTLSNDGFNFATLDIEVVSASACDQVAVTGNLSVGGGNLAVTMDVPSVNYKPADLSALDIATIGGTLDTTPFNAIAAGVFDSVDPSPSVRAAVAAHWTIEASDVTYDDAGGKIVLDASNWTGFSGDADLDDWVGLGDLSTLAFNWEKSTGMTWLTADFDLSGTVNLADLSALAFNWEQAPPAGAPPVPEPMTVGLLLVGGVALLRRRR